MMKEFKYRSKGSADDWTIEYIKAEDPEDALNKLDEIYGVIRDKTGEQTNPEVVLVEIL